MIRFLFAFWFALTAHCQSATFHRCPPEGNAQGDKAALNVLKNRWQAPTVVAPIALADVVAPLRDGEEDDSARFEKNQGVTVEGFLVAIKLEGPESCNCGSTLARDHDYHIWLGLTPTAEHKACMVVELTPRWREAKGWTAQWLMEMRGKKVRVTGWTMWDPLHASMSANSTPGAKVLARASCLEVHPITNIEVLE